MAFLSVNVNKIATLRNSRGKNTPNLLDMTQKIIHLGARGITVHPRPDERHIKRSDVSALKKLLDQPQYQKIEFNIEGYPTEDFLQLVVDTKPTQCTLVPDPPETLTSNAGWDLKNHIELLSSVVESLRGHKVRSALFIDPMSFDDTQLSALVKIGPDRIELYTEDYADSFQQKTQAEVTEKYRYWAQEIKSQGILINAGHDLNQRNLDLFLKQVQVVDEVSIGHAIFCEALEEGLEKTIHSYLKICEDHQ